MIVRSGVDVDLSVVGKGRVEWLRGTNGHYVLNGGDLQFVDLFSLHRSSS